MENNMDDQNEILTNDEINDLSSFISQDNLILETNNKLSKNDPVSVKPVIDDTTSNPVNLLDYPAWRKVISDNFPRLVLPAEAGASLFGQLLINDISNPCALVLIDVPSAGKTIALNLFSDLEKTFAIDNFTPASFVSQAANVK